MLTTTQDRLRSDFERIAEQHGRTRDALIPILQEVQSRYHQISDFAMQSIADILNIHPVEVYSVVTFYAFLNEGYHGSFVIRLCRTLSCEMQRSRAVAQQLRNDLEIDFGDTSSDGLFTLEWASCLGMCDKGPALLVNDEVFVNVTPEMVHTILESCRHNLQKLSPVGA